MHIFLLWLSIASQLLATDFDFDRLKNDKSCYVNNRVSGPIESRTDYLGRYCAGLGADYSSEIISLTVSFARGKTSIQDLAKGCLTSCASQKGVSYYYCIRERIKHCSVASYFSLVEGNYCGFGNKAQRLDSGEFAQSLREIQNGQSSTGRSTCTPAEKQIKNLDRALPTQYSHCQRSVRKGSRWDARIESCETYVNDGDRKQEPLFDDKALQQETCSEVDSACRFHDSCYEVAKSLGVSQCYCDRMATNRLDQRILYLRRRKNDNGLTSDQRTQYERELDSARTITTSLKYLHEHRSGIYKAIEKAILSIKNPDNETLRFIQDGVRNFESCQRETHPYTTFQEDPRFQ